MIKQKVLFINACVRENSRTLMLAEKVLKTITEEFEEINLNDEAVKPLDRKLLKLREDLIEKKSYEHEMFKYAQSFSRANRIVVAAPFWDLGFPALLKIYLETITVSGITFKYTQNGCQGLCNAKQLIYVTTAGGIIREDFGFSYIKSLAQGMYGIKDVVCIKAECLDALPHKAESIMEEALRNINL